MSDDISIKALMTAKLERIGRNYDRLEKEFFMLEILFSKQIEKKQAEVTERMEFCQNELNILNHLLGLVHAGSTDEGLEITPQLQQTLAKIAMLDQEPFTNPAQEEATKKAEATKRLAAENRAIEMLNEIGLPLAINYDVEKTSEEQKASLKNLIAELKDMPDHPLSKLLVTKGILLHPSLKKEHPLSHILEIKDAILNPTLTTDQLNAITEAANKIDSGSTEKDEQKRIQEQYENRQVREMLHKHKLLSYPSKLDKGNTKQLAQNIKGVLKRKEALNSLDSRKAANLESHINKLYEMLNVMAKKYSDAIERFARHIRGS